MQPYQEASQEINRQAQTPIKALKTAGAIIGGTTIAGRVLPFLSQHIPGELMRKGLSKIEPRLGKFIEGSLSNGYSLNEIRNFMSEKFTPKQEEETQENPVVKQAKDFETNYPDIVKALMTHINNGQSPQDAASILKSTKTFGKKIKKIEKDTGKNFVDFILEMMGGNQSSQMQQPQQQAQKGTIPQQQQGDYSNPLAPDIGLIPQSSNDDQNQAKQNWLNKLQQQGQNPISNDQALMAALDKILKM